VPAAGDSVPLSALWVAPDLRARCIATGRITDPQAWTLRNARALDGAPQRIGIFENLHWQGYPDSFRDMFKAMVVALAERHPECEFAILPHPAGLWSVKFIKTTGLPANLSIINPASRENLGQTGLAALASVDRVLTTPSSVAVDAAQVGLPTIIIAPSEFDVSSYQGLTTVNSAEDASVALFDTKPSELMAGAKAFLAASMLEGADAADRALRIMFQDLGCAAPATKKKAAQVS
jgi:hypothetical protein